MILKKLLIAIVLALFLAFLGIFDGVGYHVYQISETSFVRQYTYALATFKCDLVYNPILYPFYWNIGEGRINGSFTMIYIPDAYFGGRAYYPPTTQERLPVYVMHVADRGLLQNLIVLFILTCAIEVVGKRSLYLIVFGGVIGFFFFQIVGVIVGMVAGSIAVILVLRFWRDSRLAEVWKTIWQ